MVKLTSFALLGILIGVAVASTFDATSFGIASNANTFNLGRHEKVQEFSANQPYPFNVSADLRFSKRNGYMVNLTLGNTVVPLVRYPQCLL